MPEPQLHTKTINTGDILQAGEIRPIKFNLSRGKIARVLGFCVRVRGTALITAEVSLDFRKPPKAAINADPPDTLWSFQINEESAAGSQVIVISSQSYTLPKPYRTTGISAQWAASTNTSMAFVITIYYDIDNMTKDEDIQYLESTKQRHRGRF